MVIVICEKCGKEYQLESNEKPSDFQCECGGELSSKEGSEIVKNTTPTKTRKTWSEQTKGAKVGSILVLLCLGVVIILVISGISGIFSPNKTANNIANSKTYSGQGISFNYPDSWTINSNSITTPNGGTGIIYNFGLQEYASEDPPIPATLDAVAADIRSGVTGESNKNIITISGVQGIEYVPTGSGRQRVDVVFVKGDALYSIYLTTNDYNADKDGFNMIINTMKIQ